jgi:hypothetical protein
LLYEENYLQEATEVLFAVPGEGSETSEGAGREKGIEGPAGHDPQTLLAADLQQCLPV